MLLQTIAHVDPPAGRNHTFPRPSIPFPLSEKNPKNMKSGGEDIYLFVYCYKVLMTISDLQIILFG